MEYYWIPRGRQDFVDFFSVQVAGFLSLGSLRSLFVNGYWLLGPLVLSHEPCVLLLNTDYSFLVACAFI